MVARYLFWVFLLLAGLVRAQVNPPDPPPGSAGDDSLRAMGMMQDQQKLLFYNQGLDHLRRREWHPARRRFMDALQIDFSFYDARFQFAVATLGAGYHELAIEEFNILLKDSLDHRIFVHRARAYRALGREEEALRDLEKAIAMDSTYSETWYDVGLERFKQDDFQGAMEAFQRVVRYDSLNALAWHDMGSLQRVMGQPKSGIVAIRKAIKLDNNIALFYANLGAAFKDLEQYDSALAAYDKAIELDPENHIFLNSRGTIHSKREDYRAAIEDYSAAIKLKTDYAMAWNNRGNAYYNLRQYEDAIRDYDLALLINSKYANALLNRGITKQQMRDDLGACEDWAEAAGLGASLAEQYLKLYCGQGMKGGIR